MADAVGAKPEVVLLLTSNPISSLPAERIPPASECLCDSPYAHGVRVGSLRFGVLGLGLKVPTFITVLTGARTTPTLLMPISCAVLTFTLLLKP